ncbi:MAG: DUF5596 domain-containing protein [Anaerolineae bacterium]|nr:DUF5596 domain-containing protein [Anaerolineae bacterium]
MRVDLHTVLHRLGLGQEPLPPWAADWATEDAKAARAEPSILDVTFVDRAARRIGLSNGLRRALLDAAPRLAADKAISALAAHLARRMRAAQSEYERLRDEAVHWPLLTAEGTGVQGVELLSVFLWLGGVEWIDRFYREHGIPDDVLWATMSDVDIWVADYRERHGRWGLSNNWWLAYHFSGNLFRLGRLQFQFGRCHAPYHGWRLGARGAVVLFADEGLRFSEDGLAAGWADATRLPVVSHYEETPAIVRGLPIHPRGHALSTPIELDRRRWRKVLQPGDPILAVHIPAGEPMAFDACGESFRSAPTFFARHFPEHTWRAFTCGSWLLDPQFEGRLRDTSNIVRFLREFYLFPWPGATGESHFARVFGTRHVDPKTAPRDTSLRRVLLEFVEAGGKWREGGGVIFPEDGDRWGQHIYRQLFDAVIASER